MTVRRERSGGTDHYGRFFALWFVFGFLAVTAGAVAAGALWGVIGFDCEQPDVVTDWGPCAAPPNRNLWTLAIHVAQGAFGMGMEVTSVALVPAIVYAIVVTVAVAAGERLGIPRVRRHAPWVLTVGAFVVLLTVVDPGLRSLLVPGAIVTAGVVGVATRFVERQTQWETHWG